MQTATAGLPSESESFSEGKPCREHWSSRLSKSEFERQNWLISLLKNENRIVNLRKMTKNEASENSDAWRTPGNLYAI